MDSLAMATLIEVLVPDLGDVKDAPVIEVLAQLGDQVERDQTLAVLETEKATMDVPSTAAGIVREVRIKVGDRIGHGSVLVLLEPANDPAERDPAVEAQELAARPSAASLPATDAAQLPTAITAPVANPVAPPSSAPSILPPVLPDSQAATPQAATPHFPDSPQPTGTLLPHASPSVRRLARELGIDLTRVAGTGPKARILHTDVQQFVKAALAAPAPAAPAPAAVSTAGALNLLPWPQVDFARFGPIERAPLSKIKKISAANLTRNAILIPHVTNFDEADITPLEAFRLEVNEQQARAKATTKLTMLALLIKASVTALQLHPNVNSSLDGEELILKRYFHIGFAADTPNGLVVPVIRNADTKGLLAIAEEAAALAAKAREGRLAPADMQGGCFTVSSLGGIGGTGFTPIVNAPEVAILGAARSKLAPVWNGAAFDPRLILPVSLSWDHRVLDGAAAARFLSTLTGLLADLRRLSL